MDMGQFKVFLSDIGKLVDKTAKGGGEGHGALKMLESALQQDLQAAARTNLDAALLIRANKAFRKESAQKWLQEELFAKPAEYPGQRAVIRGTRGMRDLEQVTEPHKMLDQLRYNKHIQGSLGPGEYDAIKRASKDIAWLPRPPLASSDDPFTARWLMRRAGITALGAGAGGGAGYLIGNPGWGAAAGAGGALAGYEGLKTWALSDRLLGGRRLLRRGLQNQAGRGPYAGLVGAGIGHALDEED